MKPQPEAGGSTDASAAAAGSLARSRFRSVLSLILLVACLGYVGRVLWQQRREVAQALEIEVGALLALTLLMAVAHLQRAYEFTYMLRRLGIREPFWNGFWLTGAGFLLNHVPFNAGLVMRAAVLKRDHALPYTSYLALVSVNALVNVAVAGLVALVAVFSTSHSGGVSLPLVLMFGALLLASVGGLLVPRAWVPSRANFVTQRLAALAEGFALIRGGGSGLVMLGGLATSKLLMAALRMSICFAALGVDVTPLAAAVLGATTILASIVNITPGNLGLREIALAELAGVLGNAYAVGVAAASIDRAVLLGYTILSGVPGLLALRRRVPFAVSAGS